jgi:hypothetical protein
MGKNGELFDKPNKPITIWDVARSWTGRPLLTKVLKEYGKDAVKAAALKTLEDEAVEQVPYFVALLAQKAHPKAVKLEAQTDQALVELCKQSVPPIPTRGKSRWDLINALR